MNKFIVAMLFAFPVLGMPNEHQRGLSNEMVKAVLLADFMHRDSGKAVTGDFLVGCIKERTETYIEFYCDDLLWPYYLKVFKSKSHSFLYFIEDGASVENRIFFRIEGEKVKVQKDIVPTIVTHKKVASWLNKKFHTKHYTEERLRMTAHSHYRTRFSKNESGVITILSGEQAIEDHAYKPIGQVRWNGQKFELL